VFDFQDGKPNAYAFGLNQTLDTKNTIPYHYLSQNIAS